MKKHIGLVMDNIVNDDKGLVMDITSLDIEKVIHNGPATIVIFDDGTKAVSKLTEGDEYDAEKGIMLCILKRAFGNAIYRDIIKPRAEILDKQLENDLEALSLQCSLADALHLLFSPIPRPEYKGEPYECD